MNYGELKEAVKAYTHRTDLDSRIPLFIQLSISKLNRMVLSPWMEEKHTATVSTATFAVPGNYLKMRNITVSGTPLKQFTPRQGAGSDKFWSESGEVAYYSVANREISLHPAPQEPVDVVINFYARIPDFVDDTDEHPLLTNNPNIFLYGALREAGPFVQDVAATQGWAELLGEEIANENDTAYEEIWSGEPLQIQPEMTTP